MPKDFKRTDRVANAIQKELSALLRVGVRDPRLSPFITVTAVEVTRDIAYAKIFITLMSDDDEEIALNVSILNKAAGFLRTELSREIQLRSMPKLSFYYDTSIAYGNRMTTLINEALGDDEKPAPDDKLTD